MNTELSQLQTRYDELLLIENKSAADWEEIASIEMRIRQIVFPTPRRDDFTSSEWDALWSERHSYEDHRLVNCDVCQTEGCILTNDGGPDDVDYGVCPACSGERVVEVDTEPCDYLTECPSCKQMFENGGQCAATVMRGGCPMGGDF